MATNDSQDRRGADCCKICKQPRQHPFHAPKGIFGRQMETHEFVPVKDGKE